MADNSFFQIPGNIKQQFLPFVLKPDANLNKTVQSSPLLNSQCDPQYFSYKETSKYMWSGKAKLNFFPSSIQSIHINDDISFKLLYGHSHLTGKSTNKSISIQDIMNTIPGVQIREFLPDTRLDACINMFSDLFKNFTSLFKSEDSSETTDKKTLSLNEKFEHIITACRFTTKYMVGAYENGDPSFLKDIKMKNISGTDFTSYNSSFFTESGVGDYVMKFPYVLYYRLQSCVTTGIYEIPAVTSNKPILNSGGGMKGWTDGGDLLSEGGLRISKFIEKIPGIGSLANMILGNIGINYMPWWNAKAGTDGMKEPTIEIKFDLFNDSAEAAMMNFIFVNTIVPNNKWIQYNMFQHSQHIYDVKIEGINRLFACAGDFNVSYEGVLRDPPYAWVHNLVQSHANANINKETFESNILNNKLIKIPDVYRVSMTFQSLLPANFNNYIFTYAENNNHIDTYYTKVYDPSVVAEKFANAIYNYSKRVAKVWEKGDEHQGNDAAVGINETNATYTARQENNTI